MIEYKFNPAELQQLKGIYDSENELIGGPEFAYKKFHRMNERLVVTRQAVEEFSEAFEKQYNQHFGETYWV